MTAQLATPAQQWRTFFVLIAALLLLAWGASALAADAQTAGSPASATGNAQRIAAEIQKVGQELAPLFNSTQDLFEPAKRQAAAPKAIPSLKKMIRLLDELVATQPAGAQKGQEKTQLLALLAALGDREAVERIKALSTSAVAAEAAAGRSAEIFSAWLLTDGKAAGQQKVIADLGELAKKYPDQPAVAGAAIMLAGTTAPEAAATREQITSVVATLKGSAATSATQQIAVINHKFEVQAKLKALEGKPLVLEGPTPAGTPASTAQFKGKVVLVNFWASWCVPCKEELPRLKKLYAQYHNQGLEIVGVSCDSSGEDLLKFLGQNKDMPWPQLFDAAAPGWHKLADQYNVNSIPTMFLIDRKGNVRSVEARSNYEKLVPELLNEKP